MIRSVLFLRPIGGDHCEIERYFEAEQVLERSAWRPGFVGGQLHKPLNAKGLTLVTALWESDEAYQGWVDDPWRVDSHRRSAKVFETVGGERGGGTRYEVTRSVASLGGD